MAFKQLLAEKNISQTQLANALSLNRSSITKWVTGENKPSPHTRLLISKQLSIPVEQLDSYFGTTDFPERYELNAAQSRITSNVELSTEESPRAYTIELPYVPISARAGFAEVVSSSPSYSLSHFETYMLSFVKDPGGKYTKQTAVFEVNGDSMEETLPHGAKVIATQIPREKWGNIRERVVIVSFQDYLVIKRIRGNDLSTRNELLLHSDSKMPVSPYPVQLRDIQSMWLVEEFADRPLIR